MSQILQRTCIGYKFTDVFVGNLSIFDFALLCNLHVRGSRESNFKKKKISDEHRKTRCLYNAPYLYIGGFLISF